jgi:hypothetical protein
VLRSKQGSLESALGLLQRLLLLEGLGLLLLLLESLVPWEKQLAAGQPLQLLVLG